MTQPFPVTEILAHFESKSETHLLTSRYSPDFTIAVIISFYFLSRRHIINTDSQLFPPMAQTLRSRRTSQTVGILT